MKSLRLQTLLSTAIVLLVTVEAMPKPHNNVQSTTTTAGKIVSTSSTKSITTSKTMLKTSTSTSLPKTTSTTTKPNLTSSSSSKPTSNTKSTSSTVVSSTKKTTTSSSSTKSTPRTSSTTVRSTSTSTARITSPSVSKTSTTSQTTSTSSSPVLPTGITAPVCTLLANSKLSCGLQGGCCKTDDDCCSLYGCAGEITGGIFGICTSKLPLPPLPACNITQQAVQGIGGKCFLNGGCCNEDTDCCAGTECAGNAGQSEAGVCLSLSQIKSGNITQILGTITQKQIVPQMTATIVIIL